MNLIRCENGHMFDQDKYDECPYCNEKTTEDDSVTVAMRRVYDDAEQVTLPYDLLQEDSVTVRSEYKEKSSRLIAGWLVCLDGVNKGKCHSVYEGRNFAGRSREMDIYLSDDQSISRQRHFSIVYEPHKSEFLLVPENGEVYINDKPLQRVTAIEENDIIAVGESRFVFVPYCTKERNWNEKNN